MGEDFVYYPSKKKKIGIIIGLTILSFFTLFILIAFIASLTGCSANDHWINEIKAVGTKNIQVYKHGTKEAKGYAVIKTTDKNKKEFKILHLTDIHIGYGLFCIKKDISAIKAVKALINYEKPDLMVFTGDMIYPIPIQSGNLNNAKATRFFGNLIDKFDIPWTVTFGNHDTELYAMAKKSEISQIYATSNSGKWKNCMYYEGSGDEVFGDSNHIINFENADGTINKSIVMVDSNMYVGKSCLYDYDKIRDSQCAWYEKSMKDITRMYNPTLKDKKDIGKNEIVKSLAFFHIPVTEYAEAWRDKDKLDKSKFYKACGNVNEAGGVISDPADTEGKFYDRMLNLGSCEAMFVGHDHVNDFVIQYNKAPEAEENKPTNLEGNPVIDAENEIFETRTDFSKFDNGGIWLCYGKSIDYLAYLGISNRTSQRGSNVLTINTNIDNDTTGEIANRKNGDVTYTQTLLKTIIDNNLV